MGWKLSEFCYYGRILWQFYKRLLKLFLFFHDPFILWPRCHLFMPIANSCSFGLKLLSNIWPELWIFSWRFLEGMHVRHSLQFFLPANKSNSQSCLSVSMWGYSKILTGKLTVSELADLWETLNWNKTQTIQISQRKGCRRPHICQRPRSWA